ncbi:alpha/beta hydrolase [Alteripontixanthobacter muriae]|uniref:hypothetical protein n=1 Tax=Alteripontixanthobacter muriae TaxID=2705546 RepID=UPI002FC34AAE
MMVHGYTDIEVSVAPSKLMLEAFLDAGKKSELIVYKGLAHALHGSAARTEMLGKAADLVVAALK